MEAQRSSGIPQRVRVRLTMKWVAGIRFSFVVPGIGLVGELFAIFAVRCGAGVGMGVGGAGGL